MQSVVIIFVIIGIVLNVGAGPSSGEYTSYLGGERWRDPGAFANGFKGVCAVFVTAAFSFGELALPQNFKRRKFACRGG